MSSNIINWFEIPVADFDRAVAFYEAVFQASFHREEIASTRMAIFPYACPQPGGALIQLQPCRPSSDGTVVYLHAPCLEEMLKRVAAAGGKCIHGPEVLPKGIGTIALILDSEGNRV